MKNTPEDEVRLIEEVAGAWRPRDPEELVFLPAWHDLDPDARERAFDIAARLRRMEAALDPDGLSTTARAVLARIRAR
jgi:hypothetical protein